MTSHSNRLRCEQRTDIAGIFYSVRLFEGETDSVRRLLVRTVDESELPIFVMPGTVAVGSLRTGEAYCFEDVLLCRHDTSSDQQFIESVATQMRKLVTAAATEDGIEGTLGVADDDSTVRRLHTYRGDECR